MSSFYPHGKPGWFAYTEKFVSDFGGETGYLAGSNTKYPGIGIKDSAQSAVARALANLRGLIDSARAAELAFLRDTDIDLTNKEDASSIFRKMNLVLNSKHTFERGLHYMRKLSEVGRQGKDEQTYREVTRNFTHYLNTAIKEQMYGIGPATLLKMDTRRIEALINRIITQALLSSYEKVKDFVQSDGSIRGKYGNKTQARENEEEVQAITDMINVIKEIGKVGGFAQFAYLFDLQPEKLIEHKQGIKLKKSQYSDAKADSNYGGNALELITSTVAAEIGKIHINTPGLEIIGQHTGQSNQMKADTLLFVGKGHINVNDYLDYVDTNTFGNQIRMQNVDALDRYLHNLEDNLKHVIAISDKNYSITADFGGIEAQSKMNLQNAGMLLSQFGVGQVGELINYLANCGDAMIQGSVNGDVRTTLQSYIAYFLFDHLEIKVQGAHPSVNVVNLLNVSGMYIPLSVYLEGLYNSIESTLSNPSSFVSVTISLGGPTSAPTNWTSGVWGEFREEHETQSFIEYKILRGIADFIAGL